MSEINPVTKDQLFEKKIAENTGSNYNVGDISDVVPVTKDQALLKEIALNSAGQSGDITELKGKVADNASAIESIKVKMGTAITETLQVNNAYNNYYYCYSSEFSTTGMLIGYILNSDSATYAYSIMVSINKLLIISEKSQSVQLIWNPVYIEYR